MPAEPRLLASSLLLVCLAAPGGVLAQSLDPLGPAFQLGEDLEPLAQYPAVATLGDDAFVSTWRLNDRIDQSTYQGAVRARLFDSAGNSGPEFTVNTSTAGRMGLPEIAALGGGGFVVAWANERAGQSGPASDRVRARLFDGAGTPLTGEIDVSADAAEQYAPDVAALRNGGFAVTWRSDGIWIRTFAANGTPVSAAVELTGGASHGYDAPTIAASGTRVMVLWTAVGGLGGYGIWARPVSPGAVPLGPAVHVDPASLGVNRGPADVAALPDGRFVGVWSSELHTPLGGVVPLGVRGQILESDGAPAGGAFAPDGLVPGQWPSVAVLPGGDLVVAWDEETIRVRMQWLDAAGSSIGPTETVSGLPSNIGGYAAAVTTSPLGRVVVAFTGYDVVDELPDTRFPERTFVRAYDPGGGGCASTAGGGDAGASVAVLLVGLVALRRRGRA